MREIESDVSRYLSTITVINIVLGIATGTLLALIGVPNPARWGTMAALSNFIPYLGGLFTVILALLLAIAQFGFSGMLLTAMGKVAIAVLIIQSIDGWYLQPYVVGENAGLHPLTVMLALTIAGSLGGIPGMVLAVPATVILKVFGCELYHELYDQV